MEWISALIVLFACIPFILWSISHWDKIGVEKGRAATNSTLSSLRYGSHFGKRGLYDNVLSDRFPPTCGPTMGRTHEFRERGCAIGSCSIDRAATEPGPGNRGPITEIRRGPKFATRH
jgi:hypothetical protein